MYTFLASGANTGGAYFVMEGMVPPDGGPPPHIHHHKLAESFYVVEGEPEIMLGNQVLMAKAVDFVHVPKGTPIISRSVPRPLPK